MSSAATPLLRRVDSDEGAKGRSAKAALNAVRDAVLPLGLFQATMLAVYATCTQYSAGTGTLPQTYSMYKDVALMVFVGFGYLMSFLKKYGFGAIGYTFMLSAVVLQWATLVLGFFGCVEAGAWARVPVDTELLLGALYCAAAVTVSFGALIGKASPNQMVFVAIVHVMAFAGTGYLYRTVIQAVDVGGSVRIHMFGAYFGLAASVYITPPLHALERANWKDLESTYTSDVFALIGTLFLWINWPSFVAATAAPALQERAVVNAVLALSASCVATFYWSPILNKRMLDMVEVQNATLAGGVAIATAACMPLQPFGALCVGALAGTVACLGYRFLVQRLEQFGAHDSCGVHNLHGLPGILGGLVSVLMAGIAEPDEVKQLAFPHGSKQWLYQLAGLGAVLVVAILMGGITGALASRLFQSPPICYTDEMYWSVPISDGVMSNEDAHPEIERRATHRSKRGKRHWAQLHSVMRATSFLRSATRNSTNSDT